MTQKMAYLIAAGVTAFVLVIGGAVAAQAAGLWSNTTTPAAAGTAAPLAVQPEQPAQAQTNVEAAPAAATYPVSAELAAVIAGNLAPGAKLVKPAEVVDYQGTAAYEVTLDQGLVYVDVQTGQVVGSTVQPVMSANWGFGRGEGGEHEGGEHEGGEHGGAWGGLFSGAGDH